MTIPFQLSVYLIWSGRRGGWKRGAGVGGRGKYGRTVLGNARESDILVGDSRNGSSSIVNGLDANTVLGVLDSRVLDDDGLHGVVGAAANGADGETWAGLSVCCLIYRGQRAGKGLPWPPEQVPPVKVMLVPELMARQSSWFWLFQY